MSLSSSDFDSFQQAILALYACRDLSTLRSLRARIVARCLPPDAARRQRLLGLLRPHLELARHNAASISGEGSRPSPCLASFGLTPRELDVAQSLAQGKTNSEISAILLVRSRTVEKHVENILRKLGVENRTSAALLLARPH